MENNRETYDKVEFHQEILNGPDYIDFEWEDETSMFDTHPTTRWKGGLDCYMRIYRCRIPKFLENAEESEIHQWIDDNLDNIKWLD